MLGKKQNIAKEACFSTVASILRLEACLGSGGAELRISLAEPRSLQVIRLGEEYAAVCQDCCGRAGLDGGFPEEGPAVKCHGRSPGCCQRSWAPLRAWHVPGDHKASKQEWPESQSTATRHTSEDSRRLLEAGDASASLCALLQLVAEWCHGCDAAAKARTFLAATVSVVSAGAVCTAW